MRRFGSSLLLKVFIRLDQLPKVMLFNASRVSRHPLGIGGRFFDSCA